MSLADNISNTNTLTPEQENCSHPDIQVMVMTPPDNDGIRIFMSRCKICNTVFWRKGVDGNNNPVDPADCVECNSKNTDLNMLSGKTPVPLSSDMITDNNMDKQQPPIINEDDGTYTVPKVIINSRDGTKMSYNHRIDRPLLRENQMRLSAISKNKQKIMDDNITITNNEKNTPVMIPRNLITDLTQYATSGSD
jgi:hypothetical protein